MTLRSVPDLPPDPTIDLHITVRPWQWDQARNALMYWQIRTERAGEFWTSGISAKDARDALSIEGIADAWIREEPAP